MAAIRKFWSTQHRLRILAIIFGVGLIYAIPFFPAMAGIWLRIDGIEGEGTAKGHEKWIAVESFDWGVSVPTSTSGGGGTISGPPTKTDIKITKPIDKATPLLFHSVVTGSHKQTATIEFTKTISLNETVYYRLNLTDVIISSLTQNAQDSGSIPTESISLNFGKMDMTYFHFNGEKTGTPISASYDFNSTKY